MLMYRMKAVLEPGHSHSFLIVCSTSIKLEAATSSHFTEVFANPVLKHLRSFCLQTFSMVYHCSFWSLLGWIKAKTASLSRVGIVCLISWQST